MQLTANPSPGIAGHHLKAIPQLLGATRHHHLTSWLRRPGTTGHLGRLWTVGHNHRRAVLLQLGTNGHHHLTAVLRPLGINGHHHRRAVLRPPWTNEHHHRRAVLRPPWTNGQHHRRACYGHRGPTGTITAGPCSVGPRWP